mgnify:FL=1|jgi:hypothetical protein
METLKSLVMELLQNPINYTVKNWVTAIVIVVVVHQFVL